MSDVTPEKRIEGIWSGHVQGTNRGKILVRIERGANGLTAKAMLYDEQLGITEALLNGQTSGDKTEFRILDLHGLDQFLPRDGQYPLLCRRTAPRFKMNESSRPRWGKDMFRWVYA